MDDTQNFEKDEAWIGVWARRLSPKFLEYKLQKEHPIRRLVAAKANQIGKNVLDVGCASCIDYPLHKETGIKYEGLDPTQKFLDRAKKLYPGINVKLGNVLNMPYDDGVFDVVYCKDLFEHLPPEKYRRAMAEMWRVASKLVMVAFFVSPKPIETRYELKRTGHWLNHYCKPELIDFFNTLSGFGHLNVTENIGYNNSALYEVYKGSE